MIVSEIWGWLTDGINWSGENGIPTRLGEHVYYSLLTLVIASLIAIPLGVWIGHTGRAKWLVTGSNSLRAVPSLGLLFLFQLWLGPRLSGDQAYLVPSIIVLVVLAIPPILSATSSGIREVDAAARDAAKGMGMSPREVLTQVEIPNALPLIFSGLRSATLQVIATATIAAIVSLGGLGRYLIDGNASRQYEVMMGGAVVVALLALVADLLLAAIQRAVTSPGLSTNISRGRSGGRLSGRRARRDRPVTAQESVTSQEAATS